MWNEYDEEMLPEVTCAAVFGLYCGNHDGYGSGSSAHGTNPLIWPEWWSRSSNPNDYIAVECSSTDTGIYYECYEKLPYQLGDVNLDFNINIQDVIILVDYILGFVDNLTEQQLALADMNQDGIININDVLMLINSILNDNRVSTNDREELQRQRDRLQPNEQEKQSEKEKLINRILRIQNKNV
jgi:hypothetical protein